MPLAAGAKLGPYEILAPLGAGGMGEVYRATDSRLARDVALKILPKTFAGDAERMARFEREAKVLASLNHSNIASLYGLEESNSTRALVMELVEGPTLAERIKQGPLPLKEAFPIAKQIAEALEYAHERGIIHRDLKPANIKLTADGQVRILDFGLAKALEGETSETDISTSPTISAAATRAGVLLGTAAYMSPEQAKGKSVDRRTDIWAFGCVLYELLAGQPAFDGETITDTLAAVVRAEPDWSRLPQKTPNRTRELLRRCLTKDAKQRLQAIGEARIALDATIADVPDEVVAPAGATPARPLWRRALPWTVAAIAAAFATTFSTLYWRAKQPEPHPVMQFSLPLPQPLAGVFDPNPGSPFAFSPDGSQIVFVASVSGKPPQLFLLPLGQRTSTLLAGTENAYQPFFSPDGQWVGFFALGKMHKMSLHGGPATLLADAPVPHGASWAGDDTIIFGPNFGSGLMRVSAGGGALQTLTTPNAKEQEISHRWPQVLPGDKAVLFTIQTGRGAPSYDDAHIAVLSLQTGKWRTLVQGGFYARYVPSGHIIYVHAGSLMAVAFDLRRMEVTGSPVAVQEGVVTTALMSGGAEYDVTQSGLLAYVPGTAKSPTRSLAWVDRSGLTKSIPAIPRAYTSPRLSPDGKLLALLVFDPTSPNIWIYELARNTLTRLTFGPGANSTPIWSPDGRRIVYRTRGAPSFRWKRADGSGSEEVLLGHLDDPAATPYSVSPDGKTLLFGVHNSDDMWALQALSLDGSGKVQPFLQSSFFLYWPQFSPDGRWVAYMTNDSGREEVYVQPFPGPGGKWMVSTDGGNYPRWASSGREIFFRNADKMMSVPVETQPTFKAGTPRVLFETSSYLGAGNYDVAPDGQHFVMIKQEGASTSPTELNVILNWFDELKRRAPPEKK
jgi:serine/threonine protein kinase/Tol biopolymer transport system component